MSAALGDLERSLARLLDDAGLHSADWLPAVAATAAALLAGLLLLGFNAVFRSSQVEARPAPAAAAARAAEPATPARASLDVGAPSAKTPQTPQTPQTPVHADARVDVSATVVELAAADSDAARLAAIRELAACAAVVQEPDMARLNKSAELCNSILEHDGLELIRELGEQPGASPELAEEAEALLAMLVPMIWSS